MSRSPADKMFATANHQPILRQLGLDAEIIFTHAQIKVWRKLDDRENCTLDATLADNHPVKLHIKRYPPTPGPKSPAAIEVNGLELLTRAGINTVDLVAWGELADGRSFIISLDMTNFAPADVLLPKRLDFTQILTPTADLAAKLHKSGLHHRDLYLNHFFVEITPPKDRPPQIRLIDAARVKRLPGWPLRRRWIVKDLAQFWYSTLPQKISDDQRTQWLARYCQTAGETNPAKLRRSIEKKVKWIAGHDAKLKVRQPTRNVGIPD